MTKIEWTDEVWNPTTGCDRISPGCDNCYALTMAKRLKGMGQAKYQNDGDPRTSGPGFGIATHADALTEPLRWKKPRRVFVNSMSDLFHARVPREFLARVFAVMAMTPQHTYQVLSKRPTRMRDLLSSPDFEHEIARQIDAITVDLAHDQVERWAPIPGFGVYEASSHGRVRGANGVLSTSVNPSNGRETVTLWNGGDQKTVPVHRIVLMAHAPSSDPSLEACHRNGDKTDNRLANLRWGTRSENQMEKTRHGSRGGAKKINAQVAHEIREARRSGLTQQAVADRFGVSRPLVSLIENGKAWGGSGIEWPLPNVWLGTSVENQKYADLRVPALLDTPAAVRFLSCEPLLGPVDLSQWMPPTSPVPVEQAPATWAEWTWPEWVPARVREEIEGFWGVGQGRSPRDWIRDMHRQSAPAFGATLRMDDGFGPNPRQVTGRYVHAWNNVGRLVLDDDPTREYAYTSFGPRDRERARGIDWVIAGGESGPRARAVHPDWLRRLRDQAVAADVPYFMKQWGEWGPAPFIVRVCDPKVGWQGTEEELAAAKADSEARGATHVHTGHWLEKDGERSYWLHEIGHKPWSLERVGLPDGTAAIRRWGKKRAGRELDGRTWDQFPKQAAS